MPKPLIYSTSTEGHQNPIQPLRTGWQGVDAPSLIGTIRLPGNGSDHFHPTIWSRAVALDRRIADWNLSPNAAAFWSRLDPAQGDSEICDWITLHRGLGAYVQYVRRASLVRQGEEHWLQDWADGTPGQRERVPADLGQALGLADGEVIEALFHRIGKDNYLLLALGIPESVRRRFDLQLLDFLPLHSGFHARFDGDLWKQVRGDWYDPDRRRMVPFVQEDQKSEIRQSLAKAVERLPALRGIANWFPEATDAPGRLPFHWVVLKDSPGEKFALRMPADYANLAWDGPAPAPANADFLPLNATRGDSIRWNSAGGPREYPVQWIALEALFPPIAADPYNPIAPTLEEGQAGRSEPAIGPDACRWAQHATRFRAVSELACRIEGAEMPLPVISQDRATLAQALSFEFHGPHGSARRTLTASFRREEDGTLGSVRRLRDRQRAMALALFPNFAGEGWTHYWLHVGLWEGPEGLDLRPVFAEGPGGPLGLARDCKVLHYFKDGRPLALEFLDGPGHAARGVLLCPAPVALERPSAQEELSLAIDLGSSNTTMAYRIGAAGTGTSRLVSFDLRGLYQDEPLVFLDPRPEVAPGLGGNAEAADLGRLRPFGPPSQGKGKLRLLEQHLETTFMGNPRFRTYGQGHGRVIRAGYDENAKGEVRGYGRSAWWFVDRKPELGFPEREKDPTFMKIPTLAGHWSSNHGNVDAFTELLPLLELPAGATIKNQEPLFQSVFGKPMAGSGHWNLLTREIKWVWGDPQGQNNFKRAYLRELKILACAVLSQERERVFNPDRVKLILTHPEGQTLQLNDLKSNGALGNPGSITLISESRANHVYFKNNVQAAEVNDPFVFNLLMDMGGGTTDFSLLQQNDLKAYDSLGEVRDGNRVRFVGGQSLLACLARTPVPQAKDEPQGGRVQPVEAEFQSLSQFLWTHCTKDWAAPPSQAEAPGRQNQLAMLLESNWEEIHPLDNKGVRFKLFLLAYGVAYYGAQIVLHHLRPLLQADPGRERSIRVRPWLPGSGWRMMRFAAGRNHADWKYPTQFQFMKPILELAFTQARKDAHMAKEIDGHNFRIQIDDPAGGTLPHFADGIAKASVALGAALPEATLEQSEAELSVPFGFNIDAIAGGGAFAYPAWKTHAPRENDQAMGLWRDQLLKAYGPGHTIYGEMGVNDAWQDLVHPYQPFLDAKWRDGLGIPLELQRVLDDERSATRLKLIHQRALNELREAVSGEVGAITKPPLAIYLQAFLGHLFCPDWADYDRLANDPWG